METDFSSAQCLSSNPPKMALLHLLRQKVPTKPTIKPPTCPRPQSLGHVLMPGRLWSRGGFRLLGEGDTGDGEGEPEGGKESWERSYRLVVLRWRLPAPSPQLSKNSFPSSLSSQSSEGERETQVWGFTFGSMVVQ